MPLNQGNTDRDSVVNYDQVNTTYPTTRKLISAFGSVVNHLVTLWNNTTLDCIYPVGAIYISVDHTNPSALFGGEWEQISNRFLIAAGTKTAGSTGGNETITLTQAQLPSHRHTIGSSFQAKTTGISGGFQNYYPIADTNVDQSVTPYDSYTEYSGGGGTINILPPYLSVYMWKRIF